MSLPYNPDYVLPSCPIEPPVEGDSELPYPAYPQASSPVYGASIGFNPQMSGQGYPPEGSAYPPSSQCATNLSQVSGYPPLGQGYAPQPQGYPLQGQAYSPPGQGYPPPGQGYPPPVHKMEQPDSSATQPILQQPTDGLPAKAAEPPPPYDQSGPPPVPLTGPPMETIPMATDQVDHDAESPATAAADDDNSQFAFSEKSIRLAFVKKVFAILAVQMLITAGIMCLCMFQKDVKKYIQKNQWVYIASCCVQFALIIALACIDKLRRKVPLNYIFLLLYTLSVSVMLGTIASYFDAKEVLIAVGIVFLVVVVCALLGIQKKFDFTPLLGAVAVITMVLVCFGFLMIFFHNEVMRIVYASLGALLFSLWLILDIQMIMGGGKHKINPEEYIFAALAIYIDIVQLLMYVMVLVNKCRG